MIDIDKPQAWFATIAWEDVYHTNLLVAQGTLAQVLPKFRQLAESRGCVVRIYALSAAEVPVGASSDFTLMAQAGMLCQEVAHCQRDYTFDTWKRSYSYIWKELSPEQHKAELQNLAQRTALELRALQLREELTSPEGSLASSAVEPESKEEEKEQEL